MVKLLDAAGSSVNKASTDDATTTWIEAWQSGKLGLASAGLQPGHLSCALLRKRVAEFLAAAAPLCTRHLPGSAPACLCLIVRGVIQT